MLLKSGELSAGALAKKLNSQRSTIYYLTEKLKEKGFVYESLNGKTRLFKASNPKTLEKQAKETYDILLALKDCSASAIAPPPQLFLDPEEKRGFLRYGNYSIIQTVP